MLGALALCVVAAPLPAGTAPVSIRAENAQPGFSGWRVPDATGGAIEVYASETSVLPGEAIHLHVSVRDGARYRIRVLRLGWYGGVGARLLACAPGCAADEAGDARSPSPPQPTGLVRADWPVTDTIQSGPDWVSGYYLVEALLTTGAQHGSAATTYLVVRDRPGRSTAILVNVPVNTWQAYNGWGGWSLYNFSSQGSPDRANHVSFDRPFDWTRLGAQGPLRWELPLVRFLEREGYDVSYQSDVDSSRDPTSLLGHELVIVAGHGEYWTREQRDAFDAARDAGVNLAFLGANIGYWQIRYEDSYRTIVAYKSTYDPNPDPAAKTAMFRELQPPRYECELLGVQHQGGHLHWGPTDYTVTAQAAGDPWLRRTGLTAGTVLRGVVSGEHDMIPATQSPASSCGHAVTVLFHHESAADPYYENADAVRYTAPSGARVFSAGTLQLAWALDDFAPDGHSRNLVDPRLQQFMRNVLADLTHATYDLTPYLTRLTTRTADTKAILKPPGSQGIQALGENLAR